MHLRTREECPWEGVSHVQQFFRGSAVLVTGGTGFLGKVLVEKLLRCCPGLTALYLLVRPKKGRAPQQRVHELFADEVFSRLKRERPTAVNKAVAVAGDASRPGLGLSAADRQLLCRSVAVVFHVAASVRFDEELKVAAAINVRGTHEILRLAKDMANFKALVHVSTAYSQCNEPVLEERVYEAPVSPEEMLSAADLADADADADAKAKASCGAARKVDAGDQLPPGYPNSYTLTKAVAEQLVRDEGGGLATAIVRPSMVVATSQEPVVGWINNVNGPTGVCVAASIGLLHVVHCDKHAIANIVPCDLVVNCTIAAAWDVATNRSPDEKEPRVFNLVSSDTPLPWETFMGYYQRFGTAVPPLSTMWAYFLCLSTSTPKLFFYKYIVHMIPAVLADTYLLLTTGKPKLVGTYRKLHRFMDLVSYFTTRQWDFDNTQAKALWQRLAPIDRTLFPFDMRHFDWDMYFYRYVRGVRMYILKEDMNNVELAVRRWNRLQRIDLGLRAAAVAFLLWLLWGPLTVLFGL